VRSHIGAILATWPDIEFTTDSASILRQVGLLD
jgi:hypothetical protein